MGFDIHTIKQRAWDILRSNYWSAFLLIILTWVLSGIVSGLISLIMQAIALTVPSFAAALSVLTDNTAVQLANIGSVIVTAVFSAIISGIANIFAVEAIFVGQKKSYINLAKGSMQIEHLAHGFTKNYVNVIKTSLLKWVYTMIGFLLFYIPGIVLTYRYMMTPYILAENPDIDCKRALEISRAMMKGNKFNTFLLQLSFIGWFFLGVLACGMGTVFVLPYYFMAEEELYIELRNKAIENGTVTEMELSGIEIIY